MATTTPVRVPTVVFGLFALPYPTAPDLAMYRIAHTAHVMLAILLSVLIALHFLATMIHALICRDQTLARMWRVPSWFYRGSPSEGVAALFYSSSLMMRSSASLPSREMRIRHGAPLLRWRLLQGGIGHSSAAQVGAP